MLIPFVTLVIARRGPTELERIDRRRRRRRLGSVQDDSGFSHLIPEAELGRTAQDEGVQPGAPPRCGEG